MNGDEERFASEGSKKIVLGYRQDAVGTEAAVVSGDDQLQLDEVGRGPCGGHVQLDGQVEAMAAVAQQGERGAGHSEQLLGQAGQAAGHEEVREEVRVLQTPGERQLQRKGAAEAEALAWLLGPVEEP